MNTKTNAPPSADLEETAELPQLSPSMAAAIDPLSATDAWRAPNIDDTATVESLPTLSQQRSRGQRADSEPLERSLREAEIGALRSDLASVSESRGQLEHDLQSLAGNLRELEQMLNRKSEQLSVYEREVGQRDRRIAELEARIVQLDSDLLARQSTFDSVLAVRQAAFESELAMANSQRTGLRDELITARGEAQALQARNESQTAELLALKAERADLLRRSQAAELDLGQWRARGARFQESLQSLEGRRELYDGMIAEREARIAALEHSAAERERHVGAREEDLRIAVRGQEGLARELDAARTRAESAATTARDRIAALEADTRKQDEKLRELRTQSGAHEQELKAALIKEQQRNAELDAARIRADAAAATSRERIANLESEAHKQIKTLSELRTHSATREEELNASLSREQQRNAELDAARTRAEAAAASARERIESLETQTHGQTLSLSELREQTLAREQSLNAALSDEQRRSAELDAARTAAEAAAATARERVAALESEVQKQAESLHELRVQFGAVRDSLAQRNALIERVEAEAASSVAMLGNIQHNLEHMGAEEHAHLLVRTDGQTGILHLLGKRTTIGRTPDNDVHLDAEFISRHHAVALRAGAKTVIEDLNSTNGTYVNGQRVNRRTLKDGDLVTLGKTEFRYSVNKPPP
jgi:chromosome segregation ATPase